MTTTEYKPQDSIGESDFPVRLDRKLIEYLDTMYPERVPDIQWSDRKVWVEAGKRHVVRFLLRVFNEQNPASEYKGKN